MHGHTEVILVYRGTLGDMGCRVPCRHKCARGHTEVTLMHSGTLGDMGAHMEFLGDTRVNMGTLESCWRTGAHLEIWGTLETQGCLWAH